MEGQEGELVGLRTSYTENQARISYMANEIKIHTVRETNYKK
jgi:hypothetical protein